MNGRPPYPYVDEELRRVARDAYVSWQGSRYSVPWSYVGKDVWVRERESTLEIHYGAARVATHERAGRHRSSRRPSIIAASRLVTSIAVTKSWFICARPHRWWKSAP